MKRKHSKATRRKISLAQRGKRNSMYGKRHTKAALQKIRLASRGENNSMFGKKHTLVTRKKISIAMRRLRMLRVRTAAKKSV